MDEKTFGPQLEVEKAVFRVVDAANVWRDQFTQPDLIRFPRQATLIAALDAHADATAKAGQ